MKRYLLLGLVVCLALAAGGLLFAKSRYETKVRDDIESLFADLPEQVQVEAGKIDVSFLSKSATITDLKGTYTDESGAHPFTIERLAVTGLNMDAFKEGAGSVRIVSSLEADNLSFTSPQFSCSVEKYFYENISGDFDSLRKEIRKVLPALVAVYKKTDAASEVTRQRTSVPPLGDLWKALETVSIGKVAAKGYSYTIIALGGTEIAATVQSFEQNDFSLRKMGPYSAQGIKAFTNGRETLTWESLTMDSATIPSFEAFLKVLGEESAPSDEALRQTLRGQEFGIRNLRGKNLVLHDVHGGGGSAFRLADISFSYAAEAGHRVEFSFSGMSVDRKLLADAMLLSPNAHLLLPDPLNFEGAFRGNATLKDDGAYDFVAELMYCKAAALCEFTLGFDIRDLNPMASGMPGAAALQSFNASAVDTGVSDIFFTCVADAKEDATADAERAQVVARIVATRELLPNDTLKGLVDALGEFAAKSGSMLSVSLSPETPLKINQLQGVAFNSPEALGLSVSLAPAR